MKACLYFDQGAEPLSVRQATRELRALGFEVTRLRSKELLAGGWEEADLLVFAGGLDKLYDQVLSGEGTNKIRVYVEAGGTYLGLCAGAYFGCASIDFERGQPFECIAPRDLAFYDGVAVGPCLGLGTFDVRSQKGAAIAEILWKAQPLKIFYNGGCRFEGGSGKVLATYTDGSAAIVKCDVGKGKAILCGIHPEYNARYIPSTNEYLAPLIPELEPYEPFRQELFKSLLEAQG